MVGFILIIVLVSVIAIVFLGIMLRKPVEIESELRIEDFLEAASKVTTNCAISYEPNYLDVQDLIKSCLKGEPCLYGKSSCEELEKTLTKLAEDAWPVSEESFVSSYNITIEYKEEVELSLAKGKCEGSLSGGWIPIAYSGDNIYIKMQICERS